MSGSEGEIGGVDLAKKLLEAVGNPEDDSRKLANEGVRSTIFSSKYKDAIEAQLYKIHVGPDVESYNRLARLIETRIGTSGESAGSVDPTFKKRWASEENLNMFGSQGAVSEFSTMMMQMERFQ